MTGARLPDQLPSDLPLTDRQLQIVALRCEDGLSKPEIADRLSLSFWTVKTHWTRIALRSGCVRESQICYRYGRGDYTDREG